MADERRVETVHTILDTDRDSGQAFEVLELPFDSPPDPVVDEEEARVEAALARRAEIVQRPEFVKIISRAQQLTPTERKKLVSLYWQHFAMYRTPMLNIKHRVRRAYGEQQSDITFVQGHVWTQAGGVDESGSSGVASAAQDAAFVALTGHLMTEEERCLFLAPWSEVVR